MFGEYCSEAEKKKIYIINLLKRKGNELRLSEQLEEILKITKEDYARDQRYIGYHNLDFHHLCKDNQDAIDDLLDSIEDEYLNEFGVYHEIRHPITKEGRVLSR